MWRKALSNVNVGVVRSRSNIYHHPVFVNSRKVNFGRRKGVPSVDYSCLASNCNSRELVAQRKIGGGCRCSRFICHPVPVQDSYSGTRYFQIDQTNCLNVGSLVGASSTGQLEPANLSKNEYEEIAEETLETLTGYFDEILERYLIVDTDVSYSSGVLTIKLGSNGTYVINKQTPNKQVWLSSPTSGPKRYDFINKTWIYKHDGRSMYQLLTEEISKILKASDVDFEQNCTYGRAKS